MMSCRIPLLLCFSSIVFLQCAASGCFWRNGTENPNNNYVPCSIDPSNPLSTICCASWDECLPNGLCRNTVDTNFWRESCTKQDWTEGGCQEICSTEDEEQRSIDIRVQPCDGTAESLTWCCGPTKNCCADGRNITRYTVAARFGDPLPTTTVLSSSPSDSMPTATSQGSSMSSSSTHNSTIPVGNNGLSTGAKAGIGVGAVLGAITVIAMGIFIAKAMRWRRQARAIAPPYSDLPRPPSKEVYQYNLDGQNVQQLPGQESQVHELHASGSVSELGHVVTRITDGRSNETRI
ncbi:hypothetical protein Ptr902_07668 [Pyrenophora tritici-repentis]|nr:hypothetical protein Ptr902_07668 [Pyrenophora tritici-repentis]